MTKADSTRVASEDRVVTWPSQPIEVATDADRWLGGVKSSLALVVATTDATDRLAAAIEELEQAERERRIAGLDTLARDLDALAAANRALAEDRLLPERPQVLTRAQWGAAPPRGKYSWRGPLHHVVLHHTAAPTSMIGGPSVAAEARHMRQIQGWHFDRKFIDIGYHFVIAPTGRVYLGRPVDRLGAHVENHNTGTVGISLMGNFERERPTRAALAAIGYVRARLIPGGSRVYLNGHKDHRGHTTNLCPGRHLYPYTKENLA